MKLAYPVTTPEIEQPLLAFSGEPEKVFADLKPIGYQGIEPFISDPNRFEADGFLRAAENAGLEIAAVGTGPVAVIDELVFSDPNESRRQQCLDRIKSIIDFTAQAGSQLNVGKLRGPVGNDSEAIARRDSAFHEICRYAAKKGTIITLEPQSKSVIDNLNGSQESLDWIEQMDEPNLHIMLDTFHMRNEDPDPLSGFEMAGHHLLHIHFSDTDRLAPGRGGINFPPIVQKLRDLNYDRYITLEISQKPNQGAAATEAFQATVGFLQARSITG